MATVDDLENKSILEMTEKELLERLHQVRSSRRTPKKKSKAKKAAPAKAKSTGEVVDMLSPEQAAKLLEQLEGK